MNGFLIVDKPKGPSSFSVVRTVRQALGVAKAGHAGTLDPAASGVLVVALGQATRLLPYLGLEPKVYEFGVRFGSETDTLDSEGALVDQGKPIPDRVAVQAGLARFVGRIMQAPPRFSAVKIQGRRAYERARNNEEFRTVERPAHVRQFDLLSFDAGIARLRVVCSGGTYVRSLARDLAHSLGTCGYATFIRRLAVGEFRAEDAVTLDNVRDQARQRVLDVPSALGALPQVALTEAQTADIRKGRDVCLTAPAADLAVLLDAQGKALALAAKSGAAAYHPLRVLQPE